MKANYPRQDKEGGKGKPQIVYLLGAMRNGRADYRWSLGGRGVFVRKKDTPNT